jgi:hypothetical protein
MDKSNKQSEIESTDKNEITEENENKFEYTLCKIGKIINIKNEILNESLINEFIEQFNNLHENLRIKYFSKYNKIINDNETKIKNYSDFMKYYNKISKFIKECDMNNLQIKKLERSFNNLKNMYNKLCVYHKNETRNIICLFNKIIINKHMFDSCHLDPNEILPSKQNKKIQEIIIRCDKLKDKMDELDIKINKLKNQ